MRSVDHRYNIIQYNNTTITCSRENIIDSLSNEAWGALSLFLDYKCKAALSWKWQKKKREKNVATKKIKEKERIRDKEKRKESKCRKKSNGPFIKIRRNFSN